MDKSITTPSVVRGLLGTTVTGIACGLAHSMFLDAEGHAHACGWNQSGQLGVGPADPQLRKPFRLYLDDSLSLIACGGVHTLFVTRETGRLLATGSNSCGQLGIAGGDIFKPVVVDGLKHVRISFAACGEEFSLVVSVEGRVFSFGLNNVGQLGAPKPDMSAAPIEVDGLGALAVESVVCTKAQGLAVTARGQCYYWGMRPVDTGEGRQTSRAEQLATFAKKEVTRIAAGRDFFAIVVAVTDARRSFATGRCLNGTVQCGKRGKFSVTAIDKNGYMRATGGDRVACFVFHNESGTALPQKDVEVFDQQTG